MQNFTRVEPERERYAADLVLVHGLWARPAIWGPVAGGLAHRGWRCLLVDARLPLVAGPEAGPARGADLAAWCDSVDATARSLASQPVVIGHDVGGLVALALAARGAVRAAVAVAPLLDGARGLVSWAGRLAARLLGTDVDPPRVAHPCFAPFGDTARRRVVRAMAAEAGASVASLRGAALAPAAPRVPTLLVAQAADPVVPPVLVELTARGLEADFLMLPGGHWPMCDDRIDAWTTSLHRWLVQRAGESVLLLRGDEDLRED